MLEIGVWLAAIGLCDLSLAFFNRTRLKVQVFSAVSAGAIAFGVSSTAGQRMDWKFYVAVFTAATYFFWCRFSISPDTPSPRNKVETSAQAGAGRLGLVIFFCSLSILLVAALFSPHPAGYPLTDWLERFPESEFCGMGEQRFLLFVGSSLIMLSTGNGLVRNLLGAADIWVPRPGATLRGGRVIGPMERILILAFAARGELTGAALIASAKSLLRLPEVTHGYPTPKSPRDPGNGTQPEASSQLDPAMLAEYFLVGSLASWIIALVPALVFFYKK